MPNLKQKNNTSLKSIKKTQSKKQDYTKSIKIQSSYANQYAAAGDKTLIDHLKGGGNYRTGNWQGYREDLIAIVDLGKEKIDNKPYAITLDVGSSLLNKTGSWRTMKPVYLDRLPPCNNACPAGENIQQWLYHAEETGYEKAWREIMKQNPFPAIMGRVCYHPCEESCNRGDLDQPVGINSVERFLGDQAIKFDWKIEPGKSTGKKVMIVGAGPAGLSCAYHLRRQGHEVTVYEASPKAGGMIRYGIPKYRMPREKLNVEILRVQEMGVTIEFNSTVDDILAKKKEGSFDAVFLAVGAQVAKVVDIENDGAIPILSALDVLRNSENEKPTIPPIKLPQIAIF